MNNGHKVEQPKGFLVMDTCCFIDYLEHNDNGFDYNGIRNFIKENSFWVVISPYTLYEIVQDVNSFARFEKRQRELLEAGDFWVLNMNGVLDNAGFEYGLDFLFKLKMLRKEDILSFDTERNKLRREVYGSLFNKMFFYAQLCAICCLVFEECDEDGVLSPELTLQVKMIDDFFDRRKPVFEQSFDRFYSQSDGKDFFDENRHISKGKDAKVLLNEQIWDLVLQILSQTYVNQRIVINKEAVDECEYNRRIVERYYFLKEHYKSEECTPFELYRRCLRRTNKRVSIDRIIQCAFNKKEYDITMKAYLLLLTKQFSANGISGSNLSNSFIDMTNIVISELLKSRATIVMTNDKEWQKVLLSSHSSPGRLNQSFYNRFRI